MTIDWTKPIELIDGTPVVVTDGPDEDGDYWIVRTDGRGIRAISKYSFFKEYTMMCVLPDGRFEGDECYPVQVRNVK